MHERGVPSERSDRSPSGAPIERELEREEGDPRDAIVAWLNRSVPEWRTGQVGAEEIAGIPRQDLRKLANAVNAKKIPDSDFTQTIKQLIRPAQHWLEIHLDRDVWIRFATEEAFTVEILGEPVSLIRRDKK